LFSTIDERYLQEKKGKLLYYYILGCFATTIVLLSYSVYNFTESHAVNEFFYNNLSWYQHASYLSMFLAFAVGILLYHLHAKNIVERIVSPTDIVLIIYFGIFIFLLSSKAGILSLIIIVLSYIGVLLYEKQILKGITLFIITGLIIWGMFTFFSVTMSRIMDAQHTISSEKVANDATDSTSERIHIWKSALSVIKENPIFGVGTGDADDALAEYYRIKHYSGALEKKLNAHNQYLQTYIAIGIPGLIVLLGMLFIPYYLALNQRSTLYILLLSLVCFNLLFESMFERQAGVVFYAFFNGLFFFYMFTDKNRT
jgi:O-antigen ligase